MIYYNVKTSFEMDDEKGNLKTIKELYIIQAVSPTDADRIAHDEFGGQSGFKVTGIQETKIIDVVKAA